MLLDASEREILAKLFVHRNLVRWTLKMLTPPAEARASEGRCPVDLAENCTTTIIESAPPVVHEAPTIRGNFCPERFERQPWALQVSLLWNSRTPGRPSKDCARNVYDSVVNNPSVKARWAAAGERPPRVMALWSRIALQLTKAMEEAAPPRLPPNRRQALLQERIRPENLAKLMERVEAELHEWMNQQRKHSRAHRDRLTKAIRTLVRSMLCYWHCRWVFPTKSYTNEIRGFLEALKDLGFSEEIRDEFTQFLAAEDLNVQCQQAVLTSIRKDVLPVMDSGLPPGDPFDDPVFQDLFWYRVGSKPVQEWRQPFDLECWCRDCY
jgi:hypothetical protein